MQISLKPSQTIKLFTRNPKNPEQHFTADALVLSISMDQSLLGSKGEPSVEAVFADDLRHAGSADWQHSLRRLLPVVHVSHVDFVEGRRTVAYDTIAAADPRIAELEKQVAYLDELQGKYSQQYATETADRLKWQGRAEALEAELAALKQTATSSHERAERLTLDVEALNEERKYLLDAAAAKDSTAERQPEEADPYTPVTVSL